MKNMHAFLYVVLSQDVVCVDPLGCTG